MRQSEQIKRWLRGIHVPGAHISHIHLKHPAAILWCEKLCASRRFRTILLWAVLAALFALLLVWLTYKGGGSANEELVPLYCYGP